MGVTKVKAEEEKKVEKRKEKIEKTPKIKPELKTVVRIAGTDLDGEKSLWRALMGIKGISFSMSKAVCNVSGFNPNIKLGSLSEKDIEKLEEIIKDPVRFGVPSWMVNRRKDLETGKHLHLTGADVDVVRKFDIQRMIDLKTWKGFRHMLGQPVRGQRTRSSFRGGKIVGVVRKSVRTQMEKDKKK
jgi:small subunit ribosomal protein S13